MFQLLANKAETDEPGAPEWGALLPEKNNCEMVAYYMQLLHTANQGSARAIKKRGAPCKPTNDQDNSK